MKQIKTLAEDIALAISCVQDYRDTLDTDTEEGEKRYYQVGYTIDRLMTFYYQLVGLQK